MLRIDPTPNPNAMKITLPENVFGAKSQSVKAGESTEQPLLAKLVTIEGVESVFAYGDFVTVSKENGVSWEAILPHVETAYRG
ncbi:scaffolding protein [Exiguobacterium sp. SH3S2]|uniref:NifU N-terminal domain-containing protein n=1 Tax=Exiguobacterium TaxID=33986 RepID=UPI000877A3F4|nr:MULTISPECIES: NifU N-terminal domain-containing protein [Exiguobacterium]TCI27770.1 scaffolding protein [Exiguobacterium sp. SH5S4]TCI39422.1 scaffolding protein [Exiguobacterium sp. SH4S7]TCI47882.1 scaffolding protein [Exiguobacterium sp. SH5S32]TCI48872.1 scaffolding protein [Exiguobacterium sp. SH3S3]TCI54766.1 scaffolding protein [Exiguobacterium sp. SH1S4]